ncbi:hypothetical protein H5410_002548 [Solanum commersonii]|uniref:Uncharacterized protein n=1 Tax=Solanum commersonii TaxID=4109 RepID=A0A9J6B355_SOLCO|nr:hypothetical protein H5410_002548 [Solanum commersonii]
MVNVILMLRRHENYIIFTKIFFLNFKVGVGEKKCNKRKRESSVSKNGHYNHDKSETEKFLDDAWNNLMNWDDIHNNKVIHVKATIR